jgi:hypothetical protein
MQNAAEKPEGFFSAAPCIHVFRVIVHKTRQDVNGTVKLGRVREITFGVEQK